MPEPLTIDTIVQVLLLALGIYLLLALLRATRGSGLVRGLGLTLIVGVYGLWFIAGVLGLEELRHVIQSLLGFVFVILAIIFQPELRRGLATLSDNPLLSRLLKAQRKEVIAEVAAAVVTMAKKKQGALIAFERRTPLDAYIEGAVKLDSDVNRYLLDSIFHHGNALHDGAVIVREGRLVAAASLFPLSENDEISKSTGTRHRAALGITEETDAVAVTVSEETGLISICQHGKIERRIPRGQIEDVLRETLGSDHARRAEQREGEEGAEAKPGGRFSGVRDGLIAHAGQKLAALVLAIFVFYGAHQDLMGSETVSLTIEQASPDSTIGPPTANTLRVFLPSRSFEFGDGAAQACEVTFIGSHQALASLPRQPVVGTVRLTEDDLEGVDQIDLEIDEITWDGALEARMKIAWVNKPHLPIEGLDEAKVQLLSSMVRFDTSELEAFYDARTDQPEFRPQTVHVRGSVQAVAELKELVRAHEESGGPHTSLFYGGSVRAVEGEFMWEQCRLETELSDDGLKLVEPLHVRVEVMLRKVEFGTVELPIALVSLTGKGDPDRFLPPSQMAKVTVSGRGLTSSEVGTEEWTVESFSVRELVRAHARAIVDVDRMEEGSNQGRVTIHSGVEDWREVLPDLGERFEAASKDPRSSLEIRLEGETEIFLETPGPGPEEDLEAAQDGGQG